MGMLTVSGSCNHGSGSGRWNYQYFIFCDFEKIHAIDIEKDKEEKAEKLSAQEEKEAEVHE